MTEKRNILFRFIAFAIVTLLIAGAQTSFWTSVFGAFPAPALWLTIVMYLSLQRDNNEGLLSIFVLSFLMAVYTSMNDGMLALTHVALFYTARFIKSRVFAFSGWYFGVACGLAVPLFTVFQMIFSQFFETNPQANVEWFTLLIQIPLTALSGILLFPLFLFVDSFFRDDIAEGWRGV